MNKYFDEPKQVVFADPDNEGAWLIGIAYKNEIICACCGSIFEIEDVVNSVEDPEKAIFPYLYWKELDNEIKDDRDPPYGFAEATGLDIAMMNADEYDSYCGYEEDDAIGFGELVDEEEAYIEGLDPTHFI